MCIRSFPRCRDPIPPWGQRFHVLSRRQLQDCPWFDLKIFKFNNVLITSPCNKMQMQRRSSKSYLSNNFLPTEKYGMQKARNHCRDVRMQRPSEGRRLEAKKRYLQSSSLLPHGSSKISKIISVPNPNIFFPARKDSNHAKMNFEVQQYFQIKFEFGLFEGLREGLNNVHIPAKCKTSRNSKH